MDFKTKYSNIIKRNDSLLCVGLDSDLSKIPRHLYSGSNVQFNFNKAIIDATVSFVCAYKINSAFYEGLGTEGIIQLKETVDYLKTTYPEIPVILDAKRGDIGNTNYGYVQFAYEWLGVDAITLHPYLGHEALKPFLDIQDRHVFVLCRTSNPGAGEFQDLLLAEGDGEINKPLYQIVAQKVLSDWNYNKNCGLVVGATYPDEINIVRQLRDETILLTPGIGAQGGDLEKTVKAGQNSQGSGIIINASRSIIFASAHPNFADVAYKEAEKLKNEINKFRKKE